MNINSETNIYYHTDIILSLPGPHNICLVDSQQRYRYVFPLLKGVSLIAGCLFYCRLFWSSWKGILVYKMSVEIIFQNTEKFLHQMWNN